MKYVIRVIASLIILIPAARADYPLLPAEAVIPGCRVARSMEGTEGANAATSKEFAANPRLAVGAAYCAAWASEAFDRYADKPHCFTNDMSIDDLILVVVEYANQHPNYLSTPFLAIAGGQC
jgi:hypothetical protein